jgi:hypothetical protein
MGFAINARSEKARDKPHECMRVKPAKMHATYKFYSIPPKQQRLPPRRSIYKQTFARDALALFILAGGVLFHAV